MSAALALVMVCLVWSRPMMRVNCARHQHPYQQQQQQQQQSTGGVKVRDCERIDVELCRGLGYVDTGMPNLVGHETQQEAEQQLRTFTPLIQYGCSSRLTFFLCSAYLPMCTEKVLAPIGPCASLCESVRQRCQPVLNEFGFPWPPALNCSRFPPKNEGDTMCMEGPAEKEPDRHSGGAGRTSLGHWQQAPATSLPSGGGAAVNGACEEYRNPHNYVLLNRTQRCTLVCSRDDVFTADQKNFAEAWLSVWSGLCFVTTLISILTFLVDSHRFVYPERAIVFMAFCHNVCSVAYFVRLIAGRETIACRSTASSTEVGAGGPKVIVQDGLENTDCTVVFLLLYYFSAASAVWWVVLTALWCLQFGFRRPAESFARHGTTFHVLAWSIPAVTTIAVLVLRGVDADELTGMCYVGYENRTSHLWFVIVPELVVLLVGTSLLAVGFTFAFRRRKEAENADALRRPPPLPLPPPPPSMTKASMEEVRSSSIRIGVFSLVHLVLLGCVTSCHCYEYVNRHRWSVVAKEGEPAAQPMVALLMFGLAASLIIGIISAVWLWRGESLAEWQKFCSRMCRCCLGGPAKGEGKAAPGTTLSGAHPTAAFQIEAKLRPMTSRYDRGKTDCGTGGGRGGHQHCHYHHHHHHHHPQHHSHQLQQQQRMPLTSSGSTNCCETAVYPSPTSVHSRFLGSDTTVL